MNEERGLNRFLFIVIAITGWYLWSQHNDIVKLRSALSDANYNIEGANGTISDLNSQIEDARSNAWSDYDTMGRTLDGLMTNEYNVLTISDPTLN